MKPSIVIHCDSGLYSTEFAKLAGVIETRVPDLDIVLANPAFEEGNVPQVSAFLFTTVPFYPENSIFVSTVGKGRAIAVRIDNGSIILSYDNGTATMVCKHFGFKEARLLSNEYGNDGMELARCAADLANGLEFAMVGPELKKEDIVFFEMPKARIEEGLAEGEVGMLLRSFGNITFTIGTDEFEGTKIKHGDLVKVTFTYQNKTVYEETMPYQPSFGYVPHGMPVVFNGSSGYMDIGLNMESFIDTCIPGILKIDNPGDYKVRIEKIGE